ncbi:uncharacterized protein N7473_005526 [Penicillium subrubescens]|uniref:Pentatricopeptide repeat protein n=1 Tax=Penicillium subrubescens TaxID=1316194 RepID=A0A1Q5T637_9EURO|nr:uncharacterized protein N7473_005526 [Penicillium subrubescens]KAJ5896127.1 hypothetical protein N7473_005526 [Penicillium subrubescens]OKO95681.1 hypothetical protein PENSUB_11193 [Penicillium subrubescens]
MPPPNRSPSSPSLRDPPKQALDELFLSRPSMSHPKPSPYHASVRRFSTRRLRPSVASIADIFVGSLVLAGFCNEHTPRHRHLSTISMRTSETQLHRFRGKVVTSHGHGQLSAGKRWECMRSSIPSSRARSWLSTALLPVEEHSHAQDYTKSTQLKQQRGNDDTRPGSREAAGEASHRQNWPQMLDSIIDSENAAGHAKDLSPITLSADSELLSTPEGETGLSYDEKMHRMNSNLYRRILGDDYEWSEPMDVVFPKDGVHPKREAKEVTNEVGLHRLSVAKLIHVLSHEKSPSTSYLFRLYRDIPAPGVAKLPKRIRGQLLRLFAKAPNRRWADARRYLALVQDMIASEKSMSRSMWTSAVHFASRGSGSGRVLKRDLIRAIGVWQQMEHVAGIEADDVVFNILYDTAIKASQFTVADRLEQEMKRRKLDFTRFGLVAKIYSAGVQKDLDGITENFRRFVKAGDLVDTVVLNSLCSAFIRAGDPSAAEQLYARMIDAQAAKLSADRSLTTDSNRVVFEHSLSSELSKYRTNSRAFGDFLKRSQVLKRQFPEHHQALQDSIPMTPDTRTFYIFLRYYARQSGQFDKFVMILRDMENAFDVPPHQIVYMMLFEGFAIHGLQKKAWSAERLRLVWHAYLRALRTSKARLDAQQRHRSPRKMEWENPLANALHLEDELDQTVTETSDEFYMHLPSASNGTQPDSRPQSGKSDEHFEHHMDDDYDDVVNVAPEGSWKPQADADTVKADHEVAGGKMSVSALGQLNPISIGMHQPDDLDKYLENGVFVGRKMIVIILRAFGACYGPKEVMEAWLQLERLWHPHHRKAADVLAVKEELDKQLSRGPRPKL